MGRLSAELIELGELARADEASGERVEKLSRAIARAKREKEQADALFRLEAKKVEGVRENEYPDIYWQAKARVELAEVKLKQCRNDHQAEVNVRTGIGTRISHLRQKVQEKSGRQKQSLKRNLAAAPA